MFTSGAPGAATGPARLVAAHARVFAETSPTALDPALRPFLADLVRPYGNALREDLLEEGVGHSFGEMAEAMLPSIVGPDEPVDLLVLAFAMHDLRLGRATACYLSDRCSGRPMAFAVCDQGSGAAFTALRLTEAYLGSGECSRALVFIVEQSALHYELQEPAPVPDRHTAVALRLEQEGRRLGLRQHTGVDAQRVPGLLRSSLAGNDAPVIASARLAEVAPGVATVVADAGQPYTGIWWELAQGGHEGPVVLADYEPAHGLLCISTVDQLTLARPAPAVA
ncbi:hypothetical protein [Actinokineospora diospyrosa]|uniref:2-hydroxy-acid oxidase n=1 Tax=Actinokineospora diospyrosa TaxID=103728 RepID=A0ABT1IFE0_9PSEU|nr:hypothetical protein [Actinokineospora diospyrosa]MCP2271363.1 hypothetical protein [Actinokineospora diospyrosa]